MVVPDVLDVELESAVDLRWWCILVTFGLVYNGTWFETFGQNKFKTTKNTILNLYYKMFVKIC